MAYFSPKSMKNRPALRPALYLSPNLQPSPSRYEIWKEEVAMNDASMDEDVAVAPKAITGTPDVIDSTLSSEDFQRELSKQHKENEDTAEKIRSIRERNKVYIDRLIQEEKNKKHEQTILRISIDVQVREKQSLIERMGQLLEEQEEEITMLRDNKGTQGLPNSTHGKRISSLVEQIKNVEREKCNLSTKLVRAEADASLMQQGLVEEVDSLRMVVCQLENEKTNLQEKIILLRNLKDTGSTDAEKITKNLEIENANLRKQVHDDKKAFT